jgi:hypothetical protein
MATAKKTEKRSAPQKAAKRKTPSSEPYLKLADAIMHPDAKQGERVSKKLEVAHDAMKKLFAKPDPPPKKSKKPEKLTRAARAGILNPRYPERVPEKPPEPEAPKIETSVRSIYHDGQFLPALCFRKPGTLHVPCVAGDPVGGIRKFTVPASQHDKSTILQHGYGNFSAPYTPERFANHMRRIAGAAPITPEARALLLPYCPDMPHGPSPVDVIAQAGLDGPADAYEAEPAPRKLNGARKAPAGAARTSGKELIRALSVAAKLPPEKVRAKLRAAGLRAPYTDEAACRKALGVKA